MTVGQEWGDGEAAAALRAEWRDEHDEAARDAFEVWRHGRTLCDAAIGCMHRGDSVTVTVAGARFAGRIVEVGEDLVVLHTPGGRVDVHLHAAIPVALQARPGDGGRGVAAPPRTTMRARLLERESREVTVGVTAEREPLRGRLVVGADHVGVEGSDGECTWVALAGVAWVAPCD